jgi:hypothetical protein
MANTKITTNVIADGAITSAKLDTNITISGDITGTLATAAQPNITSVGTLTGFTSTGIDDNATSTAITIDSSENVGIGTTSPQGILHIDKGASGDNITILETHSAGDSKLIFSQGQTAGNWAIGYDDGSGADENSLGFAYRSDGYPSLTTHNQMILTPSGRLGIGTTSPAYKLEVESSSDADLIQIQSTAGANNTVLRLGISGDVATLNASGGSTGSLAFKTYGSERMRVNSTGVGIGTTSPSSGMQIKGDGRSLKVSSADYDIGFLGALGSGGTSVDKGYFYLKNAGTTKIQLHSDGDSYFNGGSIGIGTSSPDAKLSIHEAINTPAIEIVPTTDDNNADTAVLRLWGTRFGSANRYSEIRNVTDGSTANNELAFNTNGSERLRIDSSGNVGIKNNFPSDYNAAASDLVVGSGSGDAGMTIVGSTVSNGSIAFADGGTGATHTRGLITYDHSNDHMHFNTAGAERMRIDSSGNLLVGATDQAWSTSSGFRVNSSGQAGQFVTITNTSSTSTDECLIIHRKAAVTNGEAIQFYRDGSSVGSITLSSGSTAYNTSSDARLKDITGSARGLEVINKLNPVAYNWKEDGRADEGLIAQEVSDIVPNAVSGTEEEMYSMDYSKLVVHLVAGMKEQQTIIDDLKTRIEALEE